MVNVKQPATGILPGRARQIGYVVPDLDQAIASWVATGVGPWYRIDTHEIASTFLGEPITAKLTFAFANIGDMQVELMQPAPGSVGPHADFLAATGGGFHQFAWWTQSFDAVTVAATAAGWRELWRGGDESPARWAYYEVPGAPAPVLEVSEVTPEILAMFDMVREAAADWDGTRPVRRLGE